MEYADVGSYSARGHCKRQIHPRRFFFLSLSLALLWKLVLPVTLNLYLTRERLNRVIIILGNTFVKRARTMGWAGGSANFKTFTFNGISTKVFFLTRDKTNERFHKPTVNYLTSHCKYENFGSTNTISDFA